MEEIYTVVYVGDGDIARKEFDNWDDAVEFAEQENAEMISGELDDYVKCAFCGEWVEASDVDDDGFCSNCIDYLRNNRGEEF